MYAPTTSWTLAPSNGSKTVYVQYRDNAGNISATAQDTIILDTNQVPNNIMLPLIMKKRTVSEYPENFV